MELKKMGDIFYRPAERAFIKDKRNRAVLFPKVSKK
jgi:hypothetical protein